MTLCHNMQTNSLEGGLDFLENMIGVALQTDAKY